ncbi:sialate o-acetylesterase-like [Nannochloropsis oceanica]
MVLQRAPHRASIYGTADSKARINLTLRSMMSGDDRSYDTVADSDGHWEVLLAPENRQGPFQILVRNQMTLEDMVLEDVLFGEVWLCSGQSNMQMTVNMCLNADEEGEAAESFPLLRLLTLQTNASTTPLDDISTPMHPWSVSSKELVLGCDKQDVADRLADAALLTAYHQLEYITSTGPYIRRAIAAIVDKDVIELKLTFDNTFYGLSYTDVPGILELVLDPSLRDSPSQALLPSSFARLDNNTYSFTFPLPSSSLRTSPSPASFPPPSIWLRYAGRNNVCPTREVPREGGVASASCGIYSTGLSGPRPLLPTWKEVELLPYPGQQQQ